MLPEGLRLSLAVKALQHRPSLSILLGPSFWMICFPQISKSFESSPHRIGEEYPEAEITCLSFGDVDAISGEICPRTWNPTRTCHLWTSRTRSHNLKPTYLVTIPDSIFVSNYTCKQGYTTSCELPTLEIPPSIHQDGETPRDTQDSGICLESWSRFTSRGDWHKSWCRRRRLLWWNEVGIVGFESRWSRTRSWTPTHCKHKHRFQVHIHIPSSVGHSSW